MLGKQPDPIATTPDPVPTPVPVTSATTPPVFTAADTAPLPPPSGSAIPPSADLAKAKAAADARDFKKVKTILEKKARLGKVSTEEAQLCLDACVATKDKPCITDIKAKYPALE
jgi:hypothetical protein